MSKITPLPDREEHHLAKGKRQIDIALRSRGLPEPVRREFIAWLVDRGGGTLKCAGPSRTEIADKLWELLNPGVKELLAGKDGADR